MDPIHSLKNTELKEARKNKLKITKKKKKKWGSTQPQSVGYSGDFQDLKAQNHMVGEDSWNANWFFFLPVFSLCLPKLLLTLIHSRVHSLTGRWQEENRKGRLVSAFVLPDFWDN